MSLSSPVISYIVEGKEQTANFIFSESYDIGAQLEQSVSIDKDSDEVRILLPSYLGNISKIGIFPQITIDDPNCSCGCNDVPITYAEFVINNPPDPIRTFSLGIKDFFVYNPHPDTVSQISEIRLSTTSETKLLIKVVFYSAKEVIE